MAKRKLRPYIIEIIVVALILVTTIGSYLLTQSLLVAGDIHDENVTFVSYEVLTDNVYPVINEDDTTATMIIKPFNEDDIKLVKNFYDYTKENGEDAIVYYENTYIQNTGVDFSREATFNVLSILDGKVISVTEDDIVGKTVQIEHSNNMISIYQSLNNVTVVKNDEVKKGQIIGTSGTNAINSDLGNHLHFELSVNNILVDPVKYFNMTVED